MKTGRLTAACRRLHVSVINPKSSNTKLRRRSSRTWPRSFSLWISAGFALALCSLFNRFRLVIIRFSRVVVCFVVPCNAFCNRNFIKMLQGQDFAAVRAAWKFARQARRFKSSQSLKLEAQV